LGAISPTLNTTGVNAVKTQTVKISSSLPGNGYEKTQLPNAAIRKNMASIVTILVVQCNYL